MAKRAVEIKVTGTVQGVGFRPFVFRLANRLNIKGTVCNNSGGILIKALGDETSIDTFKKTILNHTPPLAAIRDLTEKPFAFKQVPDSFSIISSTKGDKAEVDVTRDTASCDECVKELFDPGNRRYEHPFINCTDCGPRYTIIDKLPYDRPLTSMAAFAMCEQCKSEYADPQNRRYHAQPICCPNCGPQVQWMDSDGKNVEGCSPLQETAQMLEAGKIVAIKGLGGFHLACRADSESAVALLRKRKKREEKPLAVMMPSIQHIEKYAWVREEEIRLLQSPERPIVILDAKDTSKTLAPSVAPRTPTLGIMLPYTPIHHLLFKKVNCDCLVMTSANHGGEPICHTDESALEKLAGIADGFLIHNRPIRIPLDDSIVRCNAVAPILLRRARGYTPAPIPTWTNVYGIVSLGGIMKSTVSVGRLESCYVSQYLGAAENLETLDNGEKVLRKLLDILEVTPVCYVKDSHPAGFQRRLPGHERIPITTVQHHHAHAAACMAENNLSSPAICVVYDGLGMGEDNRLWGGEILVSDYGNFRREAHLKYMPMPGGDAATIHPGRMALGALYGSALPDINGIPEWMPREERRAVTDILNSKTNCPETSAMGRLFDAMSAMLDVCRRQTYEGQPAMELEAVAEPGETGFYDIPIDPGRSPIQLDGPRLLHEAWQDYRRGASKETVSSRFHNSVARLTARAVRHISLSSGIDDVCLCGGCFQNRFLFQSLHRLLSEAKLNIHYHKALPPGDEAVSFGQCMVAAFRIKQNRGGPPCV